MTTPETGPDAIRVLVADDEPDVAAVTRLSLRGMRHDGRPVELVVTDTGAGAVEALRSDPGIAVVLLDVVMESDTAGLDACRAIRDELGNRFVRILLRTGQPGVAPERSTIDDYDIDGYLPKAELSSTRLYAAVRTALKAYGELVDLDRHRRILALLNDTAIALHPAEPLLFMLERILGAIALLAPTPLAVIGLRLLRSDGEPRRWVVHLAPPTTDPEQARSAAGAVAERVDAHLDGEDEPQPGTVADGYVVPFTLHDGTGGGWLYVAGMVPDALARSALPLLAAHAANAVYSAAVRPGAGAAPATVGTGPE